MSRVMFSLSTNIYSLYLSLSPYYLCLSSCMCVCVSLSFNKCWKLKNCISQSYMHPEFSMWFMFCPWDELAWDLEENQYYFIFPISSGGNYVDFSWSFFFPMSFVSLSCIHFRVRDNKWNMQKFPESSWLVNSKNYFEDI